MRLAVHLLLITAIGASGLCGQVVRLVTEPAAGRYLVAKEGLLDPNFAQAVVLLAHHDDEGTLGLVVNRPARVTVSKAFEDMEAAQGHEEPVFVGGPVAPMAVMALLRSKDMPEGAQSVVRDLYLVSSAELLEKQLEAGADQKKLRIFAGYSGWGPDQLAKEIEMDSWYIFEGDIGIAFDNEPATLWERLIEKTHLRFAGMPTLQWNAPGAW